MRARYPAPQLKPGADLVGTSLVESGVVKADCYLGGVETLIARYARRPVLCPPQGSRLEARPDRTNGCQGRPPALPLEIIARRGPIGRTIVSFPSTVVHTLPIVLAGSDVQVVVCEIADDWYEPKSTPRADDFLGRVTTTARRSYGLATAAY